MNTTCGKSDFRFNFTLSNPKYNKRILANCKSQKVPPYPGEIFGEIMRDLFLKLAILLYSEFSEQNKADQFRLGKRINHVKNCGTS